AREWEILPVDADRTKLPGFLTTWPKSESFDALTAAFRDANQDGEDDPDRISLMAVWLGGRLPYNLEEDENAEAKTPSPSSAADQE
ncbi:MAG TPA: hypothetical protein VMT46_18990, partial [Anaerolineaceae bacterium]|nr:hypothetical protein [Anaerolineaceae bacterium]